MRFKGVEKTNVEEYCVSEKWVRLTVGTTKDRKGRPLTIKLQGDVEPYFRDKPEARRSGRVRAYCGRALEQALDAEIFIDTRPMDAVAGCARLPVGTILWARRLEAWIPSERRRRSGARPSAGLPANRP